MSRHRTEYAAGRGMRIKPVCVSCPAVQLGVVLDGQHDESSCSRGRTSPHRPRTSRCVIHRRVLHSRSTALSHGGYNTRPNHRPSGLETRHTCSCGILTNQSAGIPKRVRVSFSFTFKQLVSPSPLTVLLISNLEPLRAGFVRIIFVLCDNALKVVFAGNLE